MIVVVGSINLDTVLRVPRWPRTGETVEASGRTSHPGGKGANQAVAAARLGAEVSLVGAVGDDAEGRLLLQGLTADGVVTAQVRVVSEARTGAASIWVDDGGANAIVLSPGANSAMSEQDVDRCLPMLRRAEILLLQLEIPLATVAYLLDRLPRRLPRVLLDPAPAQPLERLPLPRVDLLTPNRHELEHLAGPRTIEEAATSLLKAGVKGVICTRGAEGLTVWSKGKRRSLPAFAVDAVDETAAGDAFNGALAVALAQGQALDDALRWASAAGALTATRPGAQPSLPTRAELERFLTDQQ
jgi:ribokinase